MPSDERRHLDMTSVASDPRYQTRQLVRRIVKDYSKEHAWRFLGAGICMVLVALSTGAMAKVVEPMMNEVFDAKNADSLAMVAMAVMAIFLVKGVAGLGHALLMNDIGRRIIRKIQIQLFERVIGHDLESFHRIGTGPLVARFTNDAIQMYGAASNALVAFARDVLSLIVLVGVMFSLDLRLAVVVFVIFPIAVFPAIALGHRLRKIARANQELAGKITGLLSQVFQGIRHVKAYNAEEREIANVTATLNKIARLAQKAAIVSSINRPILEMLTAVAIVAVLFYGGSQVIEGSRTSGSFFAFITAMLLAYQPMRRLVGLNLAIQTGLSAAQRVFATMDTVPRIRDKPGARILSKTEGHVELRGVSFSYGASIPALDSLSIDVPAGKTVALVGPSGAGKSTILNLIPRFYEADRGAVVIDGVDVRDVTLKSLRDQMALVSQDVTLFNDTVRANIAYGRPDASEFEIERAARDAFAHDFIAEMPEGYGTVIGEQGIRLSGGQRQRLSIARAVLKDAPILLLDEATSALDTQSEKYIQDALRRLMVGRTTLIIAHRLSTISHADLIYVIESGRVIESGTHQSLIDQGGLFAHLWALQTSLGEDDLGAERMGGV